ncbi:MAG: cystathionine gamma-synthase [Pseudobacteriovorax sp.]|nr:cystathionine gamma-synthase [Pseudobacteriovorax sp.]
MSFSKQTLAARHAVDTDQHHGAVMPPVHLSSTFSFKKFGEKRQYDYTRSGNPTRSHTADILAKLEGGAGAVITSTGMSAVTLLVNTLKQGDLVVASHDCYGGTYRLLNFLREKGIIDCQFVDYSNEPALKEALDKKPKLCWVETPSNPLLRLIDIQSVANRCGPETKVVVDNTFLTPHGQQPLSLGADYVIHSTTKYINGHSDVVGGTVIAKDPGDYEQIAWLANCLGITGSPFDSYLTLRGIRTLELRFKEHCRNANAIAHRLRESSLVDQVYYPGFGSPREEQLAKTQHLLPGGMISFELDEACDIEQFVGQLQLFSLAESLGGVESLIAHPASMTHAAMPAEARKTAGISDRLLRLSVGIESLEDLWADLEAAFQNCLSTKPTPRLSQGF